MKEKPAVLIVDDQPVNLKVLQYYLNKAGVEAHCAANAAEALEKLGERSFNCLITDLQMPGTDGLELAIQVRLMVPEMPIFICTGYTSTDIRTRAEKASVPIFYKPVKYEDVVTMLHISGGRQSQAAAPIKAS